MSIFSACFSAFGSIILCIACFSYAAEMKEYVWSQVGTKFKNNWIKILDITEKNYDEWYMFAMSKVWKRQPVIKHLWQRNSKKTKQNKQTKKNLYFLQIFVMEIFFKSVLLQYLETVEISEKEEHLGLLGLEEVEESSP